MNNLENSDSTTSAHVAQIVLLPLNFQVWISFSNQKRQFFLPFETFIFLIGFY